MEISDYITHRYYYEECDDNIWFIAWNYSEIDSFEHVYKRTPKNVIIKFNDEKIK